ncbi:MAG: hypothetical protein KDK70_22300, partial [Myxococcales bacterium]|nr:hypothetical protein [Myxococcales bacterium]
PAGRHRVAARETGRPAVTLAWPLPPPGPRQDPHRDPHQDPRQGLLLRLVTGHRHQARVHLASLNRPIVGDTAYGGPAADFMHLHAAVLDLSAACPGEPRVEAPLPPRWPALSQSAGDVS